MIKPKSKPRAKPRTPKRITYDQYAEKMNEIIAKHGSVPSALVEMIQFSANVRLK
jgi:hypothetical protein